MRRTVIFGVAFAVALILVAIAVASASAAFTIGANWVKAGTKNGFTGTSWALGGLVLKATIVTAGLTIVCITTTTKGADGGNTTMTVIKVQLTGTECTGTNSKEETCNVSTSGSGNTITTELLKGELGLVAQSEATSQVGLLMEPENATNGFATLQGTCLPVTPTKVTGKIALEVTPVNLKALTTAFVGNDPTGTGSGQQIKKISPGLPPAQVEVPSLKAFGGLATAVMNASTITFEEETEVHAE